MGPCSTPLTHVDGNKLAKFTIADGGRCVRATRSALQPACLEVKHSEANARADLLSRRPRCNKRRTNSRIRGAENHVGGAATSRRRGTGEGLITYMRTDGAARRPARYPDARTTATEKRGAGVPESRDISKRSRKRQEAHEAIRPTNAGRLPAQVARQLGPGSDEARLYDSSGRERWRHRCPRRSPIESRRD